jgi:hypothetical protein
MNILSKSKRLQVIASLVEGNSIRATVRMTGAAKNTVVKLLAEIGKACEEYQGRTCRMQMRRFTRLTNALSKKIDNLAADVALHFMHYNCCRVHQTLRVMPPMEAGLADHVWSIEEIVSLLEEAERSTLAA